MGITVLVLLNHLKEKLGVYLSVYDVAMVTCYVKEMTRTCSPMLRYVFVTIIVVSTDKEWLFCSVKVNLLESDENLGHPLYGHLFDSELVLSKGNTLLEETVISI